MLLKEKEFEKIPQRTSSEVPTKEEVLNDMRLSISLDIKRDNNFYSPVATEYRNMLAGYGIYCKEEEIPRWLSMTNDLINWISRMDDVSWLYEAWTVEKAASLMSIMGEEPDWSRVEEAVTEQRHTKETMIEVTQMLLAYSPNGMAFVDHIIAPNSEYNQSREIMNAYKDEKFRTIKKERQERKNLEKRLVNVLGARLTQLNNPEQ